MAQDGKLRLKLVDEDGNYLREPVEIDLSHRLLSDRRVRSAQASRKIVVTGLHTSPGLYLLEVHPRSFEPHGQLVEILPGSFTDVEITFRRRDDQLDFTSAVQNVAGGKGDDTGSPPPPSLRNQVIAIADVRDLSLQELRSRNPELYRRLEVRIAVERKSAVLGSFEKSSQAVRDKLGTINFSLGEQPQRPLKEVILSGLQAAPAMGTGMAEEANARLLELESAGQLGDPAAVDLPLRLHPLFQRDLQNAEVFRLADVAALADPKIEKVLTRAGNLTSMSDEALKALVDEQSLTQADARALGLSASLYRIADGQVKVAEALARSTFSSLPGDKKVSRPQDLVVLDVAAWEDVLQRAGAQPPAGLDRRAHAERLRRKVTELFPTDALLQGSPPFRKPDLVARVAQANPKAELLTLDLSSAGGADLANLRFPDGLSEADRKTVLADLKAAQRAYSLTGNVDDARALLAKRYDSAFTVAGLPLETFQRESGLPPAKAREVHETAKAKATALTVATGAVLDIWRGGFDKLEVSNVAPDINDFLKRIAGFANLFGSQDYCRCEHCQSVLSPAAYFVDLMSFVETNVLDVIFKDARSTHVLNLKVRRPDLWTLPLTCENTDTLVPYLDLINEVLENYIAKPPGFTGNLGDRAAVEKYVYEQKLATTEDSFRQPFVLPLVQLDAYLAAHERSRATVARTLAAAQPELAIAVLQTSKREVELITEKKDRVEDLPFLRNVYGLPLVMKTDVTLEAFEVQPLLLSTGLSRSELGEASASRFIAAEGAFEIRSEKRDADSVQNDTERIHRLRILSLDRLHRLTRLQRRLPWSITELDLVLFQLGQARLFAHLDSTALQHLVSVLALEERWGLAVAENCALWSEIPRTPLGTSLFDRLFNLPPFAKLDGPLPKDNVRFIHPALRPSGTPLPADNTLGRLLAGLRVNDDQLAQLILNLAVPIGFKPSPPDEGFLLTAANLTILYRHARLVELLKLTVAELFQLLGQAGLSGGNVASLSDLEKLLDYHDYWRGSGLKLDDIGFITRGLVREPSAYPDKQRLAEDIVRELKDRKSLEFADTVFAFLPGVTEEQSRQIVSQNSGAIERTADGSAFRLSFTFTSTTSLTIPAGITAVDAPKAREILLQYHASRVLPVQLGRLLAVPVDKVATLLKLAGVDLAHAELAKALHGGPIGELTGLIGKLLPLAVLFRHPVFDTAALEWVLSQKTIFAVTDFNALGVATVRKVASYAVFAGAPGADAAAVRQALAGFDPKEKKFADSDTPARALRGDAALVATLLPNVTVPATALEALAKLGRCATLARDLGVDGETLKLILSGTYGDLLRASRAVLGALRSRAADEAEYLARLEPFEDRVRSRKRDALVEYLIRSFPEFDIPSDLYHHFLIDAQLEGCACTSRLVAAISSVQLYVHRCLMNLEQDRQTPPQVRVPPQSIPRDQWAWRKNYRVWEANRKVFLYPENYLEPELRDDKTPLFRELESQLLQQQINEETVLDAYAAYLSGFEEVAKLKIAGSYHDVGTNTDLLHLLGVTPGDPPTYYYRTVENARFSETPNGGGIVWTPWRKIEVQIPVRKVSPIVYQGRLLVFWVEIVTSTKNQVSSGNSKFVGYKHRLILKYTALRLDGRWTPPQSIALTSPSSFSLGDGIVDDPLTEPFEQAGWDATRLPQWWAAMNTPKYGKNFQLEPVDGYTLEGFQWDRVYPEVHPNGQLVLSLRNFLVRCPVDFYQKVIQPSINRDFVVGAQSLCSRTVSSVRSLCFGIQNLDLNLTDAYAYRSIVADERRIQAVVSSDGRSTWESTLKLGLYQQIVAGINPNDEIALVNGALSDAILDSEGDLLLIQGLLRTGLVYLLKRIGTTLRDRLSQILVTRGVDGLLNLETQKDLKEAPLPISPVATFVENKSNAGKLDFQGPYGTYFREIFFHTPFLIAHQLNSQQHFAAAQRWYHYAFDPTAGETTNPVTDRVWRYVEFRNLGKPKLREILTDNAALEVYKRDPFNPHAIARLRLSAYQKNVVMKYVDNLLDWGDSLFTQFTMESINEATLLYVLAADILGPRPAELGSCGEGTLSPKSYEKIKPALKKGSDFLLEIENLIATSGGAALARGKERVGADFVLDGATVQFFGRSEDPGASGDLARPFDWKGTRFGTWTTERGKAVGQLDHDSPLIRDLVPLYGFAEGLLSQVGASLSAESETTTSSPIFCVPENKELRQYWDRVEDRLFKIRHCLDITGARRQLALFAPEIDPRLLVGARAAGLSIEDVLNATSGNLPPYRFTYLIEKARQHAATVQSFGAALLAALEKRDLEELNRLRTVHQQNLLRLTTRMREWDIDISKDAITTLERQQTAIEYRKGYYQGLLDGGLSTAERVQQVSRHLATAMHAIDSTLSVLGGTMHLVPEVGSPFAMKYGGKQAGNSFALFAGGVRALTNLAENISSSAGLEAGFQRREEGWSHQVQLADHELKQLEKQLTAARLRQDIAERSLILHQETLKQVEEVFDFYKDRFTNLGLYTWLATNLQRLYREAYNGAYAMARLAEQAFRFERGDDVSLLLQPDTWDASKAGLLAGERLLLDLQSLERRFLETNYRSLEIDQSFSLTQIDPAALLNLREKGMCDFKLPEVFFDIFYPGHYRRRIRSVRLTIPCVTGPYTNVGATLTLTGSRLRVQPKLADPLKEVPRRRSVSIATSTAQNDSGVFEFSFRDERYMPFEGAGAISDWSLTLPKSFRPFDYQTINDVILHVSYTAEEDGVFRGEVEKQSGAVAGAILSVLSSQSLGRVFSLRQDFSSAFNRLLHGAAGTPVRIDITSKYLPLFLQGRVVKVEKGVLLVKTAAGQSVGGFKLSFNGAEQSAWTVDPARGGLFASGDLKAKLAGLKGEHTLIVQAAGDLAPATSQPGDLSALDEGKLLDILLYVEYRIDSSSP